MENFANIKTFIEVVEAGSFSRAAKGMSISAVTRRVKTLEDDLGVRLLHRNTRGLSLTEIGRAFYDRMIGLSTDLDAAVSEVKSLQLDVRGQLRVTLRHSAAMILLPSMHRLLAEHPDLKINFMVTDERRDLIANNIDVAVWLAPLPEGVVARRLCKSKRVVCGSPGYFERMGIPKTPGDLRTHNCLYYTPINAHRWRFSKGDEIEEIDICGNFSSDSSPSLLNAALSGIGVVVVFEWMVRDLLAQGKLVHVLREHEVNPHPGDADLFAVWSSTRGMSRKVRVFVDFLVELFSFPATDGGTQVPGSPGQARGADVPGTVIASE